MSPCSPTSSSAGPLPCNVFRGQRGIVPATRPVFAHDRHRRRRRVSMPLFLKAHLAGSFPQAGCSYILCRPPTPPAPSPTGYPCTFAGTPTPPAPAAKDTHTLLPAPPPRPGAGAVLAISGEQPYPGWSRWKAVFGSSPGSPHAVDRVDIATGGEADGEGELVPPPLSPTLQPSYFSPAPPPAPPAGRLPIHFCRPPPPRPRLRRDTHTLLPASPAPPAPSAGGYPYASAGTPAPPAPSAKDTRTLLPAPPPHPRLWQKIPVHFCRHPHPARAFGAPPPPPSGGRGQCMAISGEQLYPALLQDLPMLWTVGISPRGVGPTGRGNSFPLPCLSRSRDPTYLLRPTPPAPSQEYPYASLRFPPRRGYPYASAGPPLHQASGMCPVRPHGAVWWSIDRAEVPRACFGRQSLAEPPSPALQPAGGRDGGYIYIGTAR